MINIDDRVGSKDLLPLMTSPARLSKLKSGDASFLGYGPGGRTTVGIERKKLPDLIDSMQTGRLAGVQLVNMGRAFQYFYIVVEGIWRPNPKNGLLELFKRDKRRKCMAWCTIKRGDGLLMAKDIHNFLNTLNIVCSIPVVRTGTARHTAQWISGVYDWWQKPWKDHRSHRAKHMQPGISIDVSTSRLNLVARVAQEMRGVGAVKANAIGRHFNCVEDFVTAEAGDIAAIPVSERVDGAVVHVGAVVAQRIVEQIKGE